MPCYHPLQAFQRADGSVSFAEVRGDFVRSLELACGQCVGCRLERSRQWAIRCVHEAQLHAENCFVTLTYEVAPEEGLVYRHFQLFMRRLRKTGRKVRFFMCGEYGDAFGRPHFHACLFNCSFPDRTLFSERASIRSYTSAELSRLWPYGFSTIGDVTFESAAYVARYVMKKITGRDALEHYGARAPEFCQMSRKPGIGADWLRLYYADLLSGGAVVVNGVRSSIPKFYRRRMSRLQCYEQIEFASAVRALESAPDRTPERLAVREQVTQARVDSLKRSLS